MAQMVGYSENNVVFTEGPFVVVYAGGYRIEVEQKGHHCPVLPHSSIYEIERRCGLNGKTLHQEQAVKVCDLLNKMVEMKEIVLVENTWVSKEAAKLWKSILGLPVESNSEVI